MAVNRFEAILNEVICDTRPFNSLSIGEKYLLVDVQEVTSRGLALLKLFLKDQNNFKFSTWLPTMYQHVFDEAYIKEIRSKPYYVVVTDKKKFAIVFDIKCFNS